MANKKIWSYGKNIANEYIKDSLGRNRLFFIWEVLKLKKESPEHYSEITFWSTQKNETNRSRMAPVKLGFFRYIENLKGNNYSGDGQSLSHSIAILALSQLKRLNFIIGDDEICIKIKESRIDNLKVQFENGNYYFPDLICYFNKPDWLVERWGNKIALEVVVKHPCEDLKIKDFEDHNFPIIEITLNNKMLFLPEFRGRSFGENELENYYNFLINKFSEKIYGKKISNPVKVKYYNKMLKECLSEINFLKSKNQEFKILQSSNLQKFNYKIESLSKELNKVKGISLDLEKENYSLKNKGFFKKLTELFKR